jgi:thiol-disulfide isomerase/thioredoxin
MASSAAARPPPPGSTYRCSRPGGSRRPSRHGCAEPSPMAQLSLDELRGTPIVLNFWASWCYPCRQEAPTVAAGWRASGPKGVLFLGLNIQDQPGDARKFIDQFGVRYPTIREPGAEVARSYGAPGIPDTYFIDPRGRIVARVIGKVSAEQLRAGVAVANRQPRRPPAE